MLASRPPWRKPHKAAARVVCLSGLSLSLRRARFLAEDITCGYRKAVLLFTYVKLHQSSGINCI